ncbi:MAG TPA: PDZ domain-containing protein [Patescibacteria group bacterium]|nr:PDZ domain-containing protein [Patescibacteria group bacterium]
MKIVPRYIPFVAVLVAVILSAPPASAAEEARLLRYPSIMGDRVAFVYAGDIWTVPVTGGQARRITSYPEGLELFPKISPDGEWIAFSGEYAGTRQVYRVPYEGGVPERLTFYPDVGTMPPRGGYDYIVMDWTPDGAKILVRANRTPYGQRVGRYFLIDPSSEGLEEPLQIPEGGPATFSPDGRRLAYDIKSREFRTWKRYRAGRAQDVWIYDLDKNTIKRITEFEGTDNFPLWIGNAIYFTSDRERILNLYRYDIDSGDIGKVTDFDYDVLWPSRGGDRIVFECGGYLYCHDAATGETTTIEVTLGSDKPSARPAYKNVKQNIESFAISPSGARAVFSARGDLFTLPAEHGVTRNITKTDGVREMDVEWSPDGKYLSYLSEEGGDHYEIYIRPQGGDGEPKQLTRGSDSWIIHPVWSPDSKRIAYSDKKNRLWMLDVEGGRTTEVDQCLYASIDNYSFSPDSRWVCYTKDAENRMTSIWVYDTAEKKRMKLTTDFTNDLEPVFSRDGQYLFFISGRDFNYPDRRFEQRVFVGTLLKDTASPLKPLNDEETSKDDGEDKKGKKKGDEESKNGKEEEAPAIESIDADGFAGRIVGLPIDPDRYHGLSAVKGGVVYINEKRELVKFDLEKREPKTIMEDVNNYQIAADGEKFIYRSGDTYGIADLAPEQSKGAGALDFAGMEMRIDPRSEWRQIYFDAWRIMRDWFYDPEMHKVDWEAMRDRYSVLLPHVAHRTDLDFILGELIGELNAGHTYVQPGDAPRVDRVPVGLLGCEFEAGERYYRIAKIFPGRNWHEAERSPLTEPGINITAGTYLIAVDGVEVTTEHSPYRFLENRSGVQVVLTVNDKPTKSGARDVTVTPVESELSLRYLDWVSRNRAIVDELSGGRVGYIHVPNTWYDGYREFFKAFQPLMTKEALIIDERYNGGGHSPFEMVQILGNRIYSYWAVRNTELIPSPFPVHEGPKVMLINGLSSSGGDAFPYYFKEMKVGPLMGERTWGGLIGYGYSPRFVDGGGFAVPGFAFLNARGEWDVEAVGVAPDIPVFDDPTLIQQGREPMLERAVEYLLGELEKHPVREVKKPPHPDRS